MDIEDDLKRHEHLNEDIIPESRDWGPLKIIIAIFFTLIFVLWSFSYYAGSIDPSPQNIPAREEVVPLGIALGGSSIAPATLEELYKFTTPRDQEVKRIADRIASQSCDGNRVCQAKALYFFVRDEYEYIGDPVASEYIEYPREFLSIGGGDCESGTIALSSLMGSIGIYNELVLIPRHAMLKIKLPEASNRYQKDGWIFLDWTCKSCDFGQVPRKYQDLLFP